MKRICAWCKTVMGYTAEGTGETHGICEPCFSMWKSNLARRILDNEQKPDEAAANEVDHD